ncbi:MAG: hypothetical protein AAF266_03490 [Planctomycetota bacterium]
MSSVRDTYGAVFAGGSAVLMARVTYVDGTLVVPDDIATVTYDITQHSGCSTEHGSMVSGHSGVSLASGTVLTETLQTDSAWTEDSTGYNFRHEIDVSNDPAFQEANRSYRVRYVLTPVAGQPIIVRFELEAI